MTLHLTHAEWAAIAAAGSGVLFRPKPGDCPGCNPMMLADRDKSCTCYPPAEFVEAAKPCQLCDPRAWVPRKPDLPCGDCIDGRRRIAVTVPCEACNGTGTRHNLSKRWHEPCPDCNDGLVAVATVVVEWGPLVVYDRDALLYGDGLAVEWQPHVTVDEYGTALVCQRDTRYTDDWDEQPITLPPDVDPQSLVGQYAIGIKVVES